MIRLGIVGYGNLGKAAAALVPEDMTLEAIFTRRPESVSGGIGLSHLPQWKDKLDVLILCGGSAADLPVLTPALAGDFCLVDSFDNHSRIPAHFAQVDAAAKAGGKLAVISAGWDPGLFSLHRLYSAAVLPRGKSETFWGPGVSQGHSDAVRRIEGVADARQYTIPEKTALETVRSGTFPLLTPRQKHKRLCFVVAKAGADKAGIEKAIQTMPGYFADSDTTVQFISPEEMTAHHTQLPHGGIVIHTDGTSRVEYRLQTASNPRFTAGVLLACARAAHRMASRGETGCRTMFDIAPIDLLPPTFKDPLQHLL